MQRAKAGHTKSSALSASNAPGNEWVTVTVNVGYGTLRLPFKYIKYGGKIMIARCCT